MDILGGQDQAYFLTTFEKMPDDESSSPLTDYFILLHGDVTKTDLWYNSFDME